MRSTYQPENDDQHHVPLHRQQAEPQHDINPSPPPQLQLSPDLLDVPIPGRQGQAIRRQAAAQLAARQGNQALVRRVADLQLAKMDFSGQQPFTMAGSYQSRFNKQEQGYATGILAGVKLATIETTEAKNHLESTTRLIDNIKDNAGKLIGTTSDMKSVDWQEPAQQPTA